MSTEPRVLTQETNVLIHPAVHRTAGKADGQFVFTILLQNQSQIAEAFGMPIARGAVAALLARVERMLDADGGATIVNSGQVRAVIWDQAVFGADGGEQSRDEWLGALLRNLTFEPFETPSGPVHLRVSVAEHCAVADRSAFADSIGAGLPGEGASSDPEDARRLYRSDMAALSPVLSSIGGFRQIGRGRLDVDVCWQPVGGMQRSGEHAFFAASLATVSSDGQILCPSRAIEAAERLGFIEVFDQYLVSRVVDELASARGTVRLSVAVSGESLKLDRFWRGIFDRLERSTATARGLIVEIRGEACPEKSPGMWEVLAQLKQLGCRISVGNFGVSTTSIRNVVAFNPDLVTIDRHFLTTVALARSGTEALSHLIGLAHALGSEVVLDGVDTAESASAAAEMGASLQKGAWCGAPRLFRSWAGDCRGPDHELRESAARR